MSVPNPDGAERVRFLPGQVLTPEDLEAEQRYHRRRLRDHNRFVHGWGVVSGLDVRPGDAGSPPWAVEVSPGFALTPQGDHVLVPAPVTVDLATLAPAASGTVHLAVRYARCEREVGERRRVGWKLSGSPCRPPGDPSPGAPRCTATRPGACRRRP